MDQTPENTQTGLAGIEMIAKDETATTREQIIASAAERFQKYGYGKTNVAEIAADCCMSPGNLYRYFKNKADIAEAIMRRAVDEVMSELRRIAEDESRPACQRLRDFILREMSLTYHQIDTFPTLLEQVRDPQGKGPLLAHEYMDAARELIAGILGAGNRSGEFDVDDVDEVAGHIQSATDLFRYPQTSIAVSLSDRTLEDLEERAEGVVDLIIDGIAPRE